MSLIKSIETVGPEGAIYCSLSQMVSYVEARWRRYGGKRKNELDAEICPDVANCVIINFFTVSKQIEIATS